MAIAKNTQFWTSRLTGEDPTSPISTNTNNPWSGSGGSASGGAWVTTNSTYSIGGDSTMTVFCMFAFDTAPANGNVILTLDNGVKKVQVKSKGNLTQLDIVGATTITLEDLDLKMTEERAVPTTLRLTMDASGNVKCYLHEIINDADGNAGFYSLVGAATSSAGASFGNTSGTVKWYSVYYSPHGAFSPEELLPSSFATDTLSRMGLSIVEKIKEIPRPYIKTYVDDSSIVYGYDMSSKMLNRMSTPTVHVVFTRMGSPEPAALGSAAIIQDYSIAVYVTTKGTNYENAYRIGLNIIGEIFDELYTTTGLQATTDNLMSYNMSLDVKMDDDETVCVHQLDLNYRRRIKMTNR